MKLRFNSKRVFIQHLALHIIDFNVESAARGGYIYFRSAGGKAPSNKEQCAIHFKRWKGALVHTVLFTIKLKSDRRQCQTLQGYLKSLNAHKKPCTYWRFLYFSSGSQSRGRHTFTAPSADAEIRQASLGWYDNE